MVPSEAWPNPATNVSGTAWAISLPTMVVIFSRGYSMINAVTPSAPAPTEVSVTSEPKTNPNNIVPGATYCSGNQRPFCANCINLLRNNTATEVTIRAMPSQNLMVDTALLDCTSIVFKNRMVAMEAGMLPIANSFTIRQSMLPSLPCAKIPTDLVNEA